MSTVLIADDEPDHRELISLMVSRLGHQVVTVPDAAGALEALASGGIDAVLLDVRMPGVSGIDLCRRIRTDPATAEMPIMVVSADVSRHPIAAALHAGADDYLAKPFTRAEMTVHLETLLGPGATAARRAAAATAAAMLAARHALAPAKSADRREIQLRRTA